MQLTPVHRAALVGAGLVFSLFGCGGGGSTGSSGVESGLSATVTSVSVSCSPSSIQVNQNSKCTASVTGTGAFNSAVSWSVDNGSIDQSGNYTAPATPTTATVKAVSVQDATKSGTATVAVNAAGVALASLAFNPDNVVSGNSSVGTVTGTSSAPSGGLVVGLSSSDNNAAAIPSSVTIPAGSTKATFTLNAGAVASATVVTVTASSATNVTATVTVNPATTVTWAGGPGPAIPVSDQCFAGDFNGDGKADLACYTGGSGSWNVALSTGAGWNSQFWNGGPGVALPVTNRCFTGDFDGDGKTDLACYTGVNGSWNLALSTGTGWDSQFWNGGPAPSLPVFEGCFTGDFDGNGKTDLACDLGNGDWNVALSTGNGWQSMVWSGGPNLQALLAFGECFARDFDGDGKTDLACYASGRDWTVALSTGNGWQLSVWSQTTGGDHTLPVIELCFANDFNGDRKTDVACFDSGPDALVNLSTGTGWVTSFWNGTPDQAVSNVPVSNYCFTADFNGDAKADLACAPGTKGIWPVALSTGTSWQLSGWSGGPVPSIPIGNQCFAVDFNGDGKTDVACYTGSAGLWNVALSTGSGW